MLTDIEMENGVALIDMGGGSTSVTIYHGNILRHYASIPFGGRNITQDIKNELQISERLAENIKLAFGACLPDKLQSLSEKVLLISGQTAVQDKEITVKYLSEIITARVEEIVEAMLYEINESGLAEHLRGGIVITGGCAHTANLGLLISQMSGYKVRVGFPMTGFSFQGVDGVSDTIASTSMGLIKAALDEEGMNCAVYEENYHTEVEMTPEQMPEPMPVPVDEPQPYPVYEPMPEPAHEHVQEPVQEDPEDYDPELDYEAEDKSDDKNFIEIIWGGIKRKIKKVEDRTDDMIGKMY